jgi:Icc-related predicted phosphoesterase
MKWLLVSDLHYTLKQLDWLNSVADRFDVVVIAGDMLDISSTVPVAAQIVVVLKYIRLLSRRTRLLVCSGNHDLNALSAAGEKTAGWMQRVRHLGVPCDNDRVDLDATTVTLCPWWDGPVACRQIGEQLARDSGQRAESWVWVYHAPPEQSPVSWAGKRYFGDSHLLEWIRQYQPAMVLTGHIHQSPFKVDGSWVDRIGETWVFNPGRQIGPVPTQVIIDTDKDEAIWLSLAGAERVALDAPLQRPVETLA